MYSEVRNSNVETKLCCLVNPTIYCDSCGWRLCSTCVSGKKHDRTVGVYVLNKKWYCAFCYEKILNS